MNVFFFCWLVNFTLYLFVVDYLVFVAIYTENSSLRPFDFDSTLWSRIVVRHVGVVASWYLLVIWSPV